MTQEPNDVRSAVVAYYAAVSKGDIERIAPMFAADGVMRDPVGAPLASDDASRRQRYGRIAAAFASFAMVADEIIVCGDEAGARWTARGETTAGVAVAFEGMSTFAFDADRRITMMSAYFDLGALVSAMAGGTEASQ